MIYSLTSASSRPWRIVSSIGKETGSGLAGDYWQMIPLLMNERLDVWDGEMRHAWLVEITLVTYVSDVCLPNLTPMGIEIDMKRRPR